MMQVAVLWVGLVREVHGGLAALPLRTSVATVVWQTAGESGPRKLVARPGIGGT